MGMPESPFDNPPIYVRAKSLVDTSGITLKCPHCGRKVENVSRAEHDPPHAAVLVMPCDCTQGCKIEAVEYYDADGKLIDWFAWDAKRKEAT